MVAKTRNLQFVPTMPSVGTTRLPNLLVAGCSYVWNNSEDHASTWPYYLQDALQFKKVFDCSQSGSGTNLSLNAVINETVTGDLSAQDTLVCVMWSGLERTDIIVSNDDELRKHNSMSVHQYNEKFGNASLFPNSSNGPNPYDQLAYLYKRIVPFSAQQYQSLINIIALGEYLSSTGFPFLFLTWKPWNKQTLLKNHIPESLIDRAHDMIHPLKTLDEFAEENQMRILNDGHPTPDAHLEWTKKYLVPVLGQRFSSSIELY